MVYDDIITRLRTVYQAGRPIRLVIARTVSVETSTGEVPDINDVSASIILFFIFIFYTVYRVSNVTFFQLRIASFKSKETQRVSMRIHSHALRAIRNS